MSLLRVSIATLPLIAAGAALAQYKVVGPDGSVTYTDRPPVAAPGTVTPVRRNSAPPTSSTGDASLPLDLRGIAARYPVLFYTSANCQPCDAARQMLRERGVPYAERRAASEEDSAALERLVGARTVPSMTVGQQALRGYNAADWQSYLDAAGYPRESRLPRTWQPPAVTPLVQRENPASAPAGTPVAAAPPAAPAPAPAPAAAPATGVRF